MKCKPYSEITVEIPTQLKTVKITSNIFAVHHSIPSLSLNLVKARQKFSSPLLLFLFLYFLLPKEINSKFPEMGWGFLP